MSRGDVRGRERWLAIGLALSGLLLIGQGGWIQAKAWLAQRLLEQAWAATLVDGDAHRPWSWADHFPVARLQVPHLGIDQIVLEGDSGAVLAFAPGHHPESGLPSGTRTALISGHRDTHFRFLRDLSPGDALLLRDTRGQHLYRMLSAEVVDSRTRRVAISETAGDLLLVTCWPFSATASGGSLRYVVRFERQPSVPTGQLAGRIDSAVSGEPVDGAT